MTRALITGITGMVGSHLAEYLIANTDWDVYGLCRWRSPLDNLETLVPRINRADRCFLLYGDLRDTLSIQEAVRKSEPDYVFHLAAQSFPRTSFDAPLDTFDTNIQGTARVLDALRTVEARRDHPCLRLVRGVRPRAARETADRRGMHVPSGLALRDLQGRHRSHRPFLRRGVRHDGDDDADVHAYGAAARRRLRRIDIRQADRAHRGGPAAAGGQGRQSQFAAHDRRRARRGARLLHAADREARGRRLLQYRWDAPGDDARDPRFAPRALAQEETRSASRSIPRGSGRSTPICRSRTPRNFGATPAGRPRFPTSARSAISSTIGASA